MKEFEYVKATSLEEALILLEQFGPEAKIIAGGNALLILMKQGLFSPRRLISIWEAPGLDDLRHDEKGGLRIGALVTHRMLETSPLVNKSFGVLAEMAHQMANVRVRNTGTVGGNLCHADPHSDPPALLIALGASVKAVGLKGERKISLEEFFLDFYETALERDEILTEVLVPKIPPRTGCAYYRFTTRSQTDKPCLTVAVVLTLTPDLSWCEKARIVVGAVGSTPVRTREAEERIMRESLTEESIQQAALAAAREVNPMSDLYGSDWYKREMTKLLVQKGISEAMTRAKGQHL